MADVADDVVNHLANGMQKVSDGLTSVAQAAAKIAPDAWKVLVHQQKALAVQDIITGSIIFLFVLFGLFIYKKAVYNQFATLMAKDPDYIGGQIAFGIIAIIASTTGIFISVNHVTDGFVRYNSAEYYAAQDALSIIKK